MHEPSHAESRRRRADDADGSFTEALGRHRRTDTAQRRRRMRFTPQLDRSVWPLGQQTLASEGLDRMVDRLAGRSTEHGDELVNCPSAVEERQQPGQQPPDCSPLEDDDALAMLEEEALAVVRDAIPRCEKRSARNGRRHSSAPERGHQMSQPHQQNHRQEQEQQEQQSMTAAKCSPPSPRTFAVRSSSSSVSLSNM
jgi:hypothetical protein